VCQAFLCSSGCAASDTSPAASGTPAALPAVFVLTPDPAVGAHALAAAVAVEAPDAVIFADGRAPAVLAGAPDAIMLADGALPQTSCTCSFGGYACDDRED
jgi:hypothetical protein